MNKITDISFENGHLVSKYPITAKEGRILYEIATNSQYGIYALYFLYKNNLDQYVEALNKIRKTGIPNQTYAGLKSMVEMFMPLVEQYKLKANIFTVREAGKALTGDNQDWKNEMIELLRSKEATQLKVRALNAKYK